jgi:hypothetical protein
VITLRYSDPSGLIRRQDKTWAVRRRGESGDLMEADGREIRIIEPANLARLEEHSGTAVPED